MNKNMPRFCAQCGFTRLKKCAIIGLNRNLCVADSGVQRLHTTLEMEEKILMKRTILAVSAFAASLMVSAVAVSAPVQAEEIFHSRKAVAEVVATTPLYEA